jgi:hypothetical protein
MSVGLQTCDEFGQWCLDVPFKLNYRLERMTRMENTSNYGRVSMFGGCDLFTEARWFQGWME